MEGVLEVYARPPLPVRPASPAKEDYEYVRHGMANLFMAFEPLTGKRRVEVTERKTKADFARLLKRIAEEWYADAERGTLVVDNLSMHKPAVLYEVFEPAEARRLLGRLEFVYTPKHGSWLNAAECELSVLSRQCLDRRIPDMDALQREVATWEADRNAAAVKVDWQFTTAGARIKLKRLYPVLEDVNSGVGTTRVALGLETWSSCESFLPEAERDPLKKPLIRPSGKEHRHRQELIALV
ncbi:MAG: hypothetical protein ABS79_06960 [Planctomycetes bacterium SCN 63-9]|nr:MAG: hypothetical protein ABS79_06960 [Planctomycetes bacterium SCN 63-9]